MVIKARYALDADIFWTGQKEKRAMYGTESSVLISLGFIIIAAFVLWILPELNDWK